MSACRALESLTAAELETISTLWKRERRELVTSFGGVSMLPAIAPGEQVLVQCGVEPAIGEVAVFLFDNQIGVHRVVARSPAWLLTWGDANPLPDEPIAPGQVIGAIRQGHARNGSLSRFLLAHLFASSRMPLDRLTERVRLAYRVRAAWAQGPVPFCAKVLRALQRRLFA